MSRRSRFSIVVPVYQNVVNLPETVPKLLGLSNRIPDSELELVFVDDGSTDGSFDLLRKFALEHPSVIRVIKFSRNFGQSAAVHAGLKFATGDCVGIISADLQEPYDAFAEMHASWRAGHKFVIGERVSREEGYVHRALSNGYWKMVRRHALPGLPAMGYDFCLLDRQIVNEFVRMNERNVNVFVLIYWLGFHPVRQPIVRSARARGKSQWGFARRARALVDTLIGFTNIPARVLTVTGFGLGLSALCYLVVMAGLWFYFDAVVPGWMTVIGLLTLFGSMILFGLGIISEYLLRILDEVRQRPLYVVDECLGLEASELTEQRAA